jgi:hypothetical protein
MRSVKIGGVTIQQGNSKMGAVMHINLPPPKTCAGRLCFKTGCYGMKFYKLRKEVKRSWDGNWAALEQNRGAYFEAVSQAISRHQPRLFRWHSAGDIPDVNYWYRMHRLAVQHPGTKFMAFTKAYDTLAWARLYGDQTLPGNLTVLLSGWPGMETPQALKQVYPTAWMNDPKKPDPNIPVDAIPCSGKCETCGVCWALRPGQSVVFDRH